MGTSLYAMQEIEMRGVGILLDVFLNCGIMWTYISFVMAVVSMNGQVAMQSPKKKGGKEERGIYIIPNDRKDQMRHGDVPT